MLIFSARPYMLENMGKNDNLAAEFGKILRELRKAAGLSQGQLGQRVNKPMQIQAIARYEAGSTLPTLDVLTRLADALGCDPCKLIPKRKPKRKAGPGT